LVFWISVGVTSFFLGLLCTLDLPWISIINFLRKIFPTKAEIELKRQADQAKIVPEYKEEEKPKPKEKAVLVKPEILQSSEEEMLKKFRNALVQQNKNNNNNSRMTPTDLEINSRLSRRAITNDKY